MEKRGYLHHTKYLRLSTYVQRDLRRFNLLIEKPKSIILDIGSGPCYFGFIGMLQGHRVTCMDIHEPLYDFLSALLGVRKLYQAVEKQQVLKNIRQSDYITAFDICFGVGWNSFDWEFFLKDVKTHLKPRGQLILLPNCADPCRTFLVSRCSSYKKSFLIFEKGDL